MLKIFLIIGLLIPGMERPVIQKTEFPTIEECVSQLTEFLNASKAHEGEEFQTSAACKVEGTKANPA